MYYLSVLRNVLWIYFGYLSIIIIISTLPLKTLACDHLTPGFWYRYQCPLTASRRVVISMPPHHSMAYDDINVPSPLAGTGVWWPNPGRCAAISISPSPLPGVWPPTTGVWCPDPCRLCHTWPKCTYRSLAYDALIHAVYAIRGLNVRLNPLMPEVCKHLGQTGCRILPWKFNYHNII
jgi:hypothetical protein